MTFLVDALATYRVTRLIVEDKITEDLRDLVWKRFPPDSTKVGYLLTCPHCTSMWVAALIAAARTVSPKTSQPLLRGMAIAAAVSLLNDARAWADVVD